MIRGWGLVVGVVGLVIGASAQPAAVSGSLHTSDGHPIAYASVTLCNVQGRVVVFKASDATGHFRIVLPANAHRDSLRLRVNHLGYAPIDLLLTAGRSRYDLILAEQVINLSEVAIKSRPRIDVQSDTLRYDVASFTKPEDRSIGDVLRRMPGIAVTEEGQINYNGQPISHFYIDGDDLLNDKYRIGTRTIPHAMVNKLEVLQNHQPLKVLKNKSITDLVAINLVIKDDAKRKLTGQAKLGAGLPHQYDGELNTILFNKKQKLLHVLKGNNVGEDLASDFTSSAASAKQAGAAHSPPQALLAAGTVGNPALPRQRYYLNNSGSLHANNLVNLKNGLQLKVNAYGLLDRNTLAYNSLNTLSLGSDTIRYTEQQAIGRNPFLTETSLTATTNEKTHYFNNVLTLAYSGETGTASLTSNDQPLHQQLRSRIREFSNTLTYTPALKSGDVINSYWSLNHYNQPQTLIINPGIHAHVLNGGAPYAHIRQFAETPTWFNRLSAAYRHAGGIIKQRYEVGMTNEWQQLRSALRLTQDDGSIHPYRGSHDNNLQWQRHQVFVDGTYEYQRRRLEATLMLPLAIQRTTYRDAAFQLHQTDQRLLFNPSLRVKVMTTVEDYLSFTYHYGNHLGNINGIFRGAILANYRSIQANDARLQERDSHAFGLRYHYQRAIQLLFIHAGLTYTQVTANTIPSTIVTDNIARTVLLPFTNNVSSVNANGGLSQYIFALGATASLQASWSSSRSNQLLNGEALPFHNQSFTLHPGVEARLFNLVSITYNGSGTWSTSRLAQRNVRRAVSSGQLLHLDQSIGLTYSPVKNTFLRIDGRHQHTSQQQQPAVNYFFADANIRHQLLRWRTDVELQLTNLANVTSYQTYTLSANQSGHSQYILRGRMVLLKVTFSL